MRYHHEKSIPSISSCFQELRRSNIVEIEHLQDLTLETALSEALDRLIHARLEAHWHKVSPKVRRQSTPPGNLA